MGVTAGCAAVVTCLGAAAAQAAMGAFVGPLHSIRVVASTVPRNGDVNPYGVAVVPRSTGRLHRGSVLVSNFNAASNLQGTGTTIVQISPGGHRTTFATLRSGMLPGRCPGGVGLTTALGVLRSGWVVVGSLPTTDGSSATARAGCLIVLDSRGRAVETLSGGSINGPWDMATVDRGDGATLFVANVLNGTVAAGGATVNRGTVVRIGLRIHAGGMPTMTSERVVARGFGEHSDPAALVVGPTGLALGASGTLYVADSAGNRIAAVPDALRRMHAAWRGRTVTMDGALNVPLGLTVAPGGDILTVNAGDGRLVETTPGGRQIAVRWLDTSGSPAGAGALFGLAIRPDRHAVYFVDDATNQLDLLH
jgi:sugar lactone lactonase YvrE